MIEQEEDYVAVRGKWDEEIALQVNGYKIEYYRGCFFIQKLSTFFGGSMSELTDMVIKRKRYLRERVRGHGENNQGLVGNGAASGTANTVRLVPYLTLRVAAHCVL